MTPREALGYHFSEPVFRGASMKMGGTAVSKISRLSLSVLAAVSALATGVAAAQAQTAMTLIPQADLRSFDPVWNTAQITVNHAFMVYDNLFGMDKSFAPKPQMVESYTATPDGLKHSFTLRAGMTFHDGTPVTAKDAVASLQRFGKKAVDGRALFERVASIGATGDLGFEIVLKEPFGPILDVLANPVLPPFVMREKDALTDPATQITDAVGSGPFIFVKDEWTPGDKVVYRKNAAYKARSEPANGYAGSRQPKLDRVVWKYIPDPQTQAQALIRGEADALELPQVDLLPLLKRDPNIVVEVLNKPGVFGMIRFNGLFPPFNDARIRQAVAMGIDQKQYLAGMVGNPEYERECYALFQCGSPNETDVGTEPFRARNLEAARKLVKDAGYDGKPVVVLDPTDQIIIHNIAILTSQTLKDIGINVDLQATDWATVTTRRGRKDPPGPGSQGWNIFTTWSSSAIMSSPVTNFALQATCDGNNWFGWVCDDEIERLRKVYMAAVDPAQRKKAIEDLQRRYYQVMPYVMTGQFQSPVAYRKSLSGIPGALSWVSWGVEKK